MPFYVLFLMVRVQFYKAERNAMKSPKVTKNLTSKKSLAVSKDLPIQAFKDKANKLKEEGKKVTFNDLIMALVS